MANNDAMNQLLRARMQPRPQPVFELGPAGEVRLTLATEHKTDESNDQEATSDQNTDRAN